MTDQTWTFPIRLDVERKEITLLETNDVFEIDIHNPTDYAIYIHNLMVIIDLYNTLPNNEKYMTAFHKDGCYMITISTQCTTKNNMSYCNKFIIMLLLNSIILQFDTINEYGAYALMTIAATKLEPVILK
jgi:hypothetical protein